MNFKEMTLLQLKAYAKEKGIRGVSTLKKNQLIERIIASENKSIQTKAEESIKSEKNTTSENGIKTEKNCKIIYKEGMGELVEKKSRFIAQIRPVKSEEEALAFVEETRKKYWDARHNCYAYILKGEGATPTARCSDDGEPSQTAGKPMLDVLMGEGLMDVCAVVTRYFGGTLLGTGGLVRAYSGAVKEGLANAQILEKKQGVRMEVITDYNGVGKIQYLAAQEGIDTLDSQYTDKVVFIFLVPGEQEESFKAKLVESTNGRAVIRTDGEVYYGKCGGELILL